MLGGTGVSTDIMEIGMGLAEQIDKVSHKKRKQLIVAVLTTVVALLDGFAAMLSGIPVIIILDAFLWLCAGFQWCIWLSFDTKEVIYKTIKSELIKNEK